MRCAYIILAHRYPVQLARLVRALTSEGGEPTGDVAWIHLDRSVGISTFRAALSDSGISPAAYRFVEGRVAGAWGDFSLVQATLNSMRECVGEGAGADQLRGYDYISLLSGQDYPLRSPQEIKSRLAQLPSAEYMAYFTLPYAGWYAHNGGLDRVNLYYNLAMVSRLGRVPVAGRYLARAFDLGLKLVPKRRRLDGIKLYGGWQWWTLTEGCVRHVLHYQDQHPEFTGFYRYSLIPDEGFFQTLIMNSPYAGRVVNDYLRWIEWDGVQPSVLTEADAERAIKSECLFARKFDMERQPAALDRVDEFIASGRPLEAVI